MIFTSSPSLPTGVQKNKVSDADAKCSYPRLSSGSFVQPAGCDDEWAYMKESHDSSGACAVPPVSIRSGSLRIH